MAAAVARDTRLQLAGFGAIGRTDGRDLAELVVQYVVTWQTVGAMAYDDDRWTFDVPLSNLPKPD